MVRLILNLSLMVLVLFAIGCKDAGEAVGEKAKAQKETIPQAVVNEQPSKRTVGEIVFSSPKYTFTLAEAAKGVTIDYQLVVKNDIQGVFLYRYDLDGNGPLPIATIEGNGQYYGIHDGGGAPPIWEPNTLKKGTYSHSFKWDGRNWTGLSDWGNTKGEPFPAGTYKLSVVCGRSKPLDRSNPSPASTEYISIADGVAIIEIVED